MRNWGVVMAGLWLGACAPEVRQSQPSFSQPSSYSAPFSASQQSFSVPQHEMGDELALVVRPDQVAENFAVRVTGKDRAEAMRNLEAAVAALRKTYVDMTGGKASLRLCGFRLEKDGEHAQAATADGVIEAALPRELDYWGRAQLISVLAEAEEKVKFIEKEAEQAKKEAGHPQQVAPTTRTGFGSPSLFVKDTAGYRNELIKRWAERVRAFTTDAAAAVKIDQCEPPEAVTQRFISLEEVALSLRVQCRLTK